jgi:hypothetical protein
MLARELVRFVCSRHDVVVVCNIPDKPLGSVAIVASPLAQRVGEDAVTDAPQWLRPAADLYYPDDWRLIVTIGTSGPDIAKKIEREGLSVHVVDQGKPPAA